VFALTTSGAFASAGTMATLMTLRLLIITRER
jgi:hypothetical protein